MRKLLLILCLFLFSRLFGASAQSLTPEDFARGVHVNIVEGEPLQVIVIPREVYGTVTRADLGDVRIFNEAGEEVPYAVFRDGFAQSSPLREHMLPLFPIRGRPGADPGTLDVQVRTTETGALVQVNRQPAGGTAGQTVRAYIVDASELEVPVRQLTFSWADTVSFISDLVAETSSDLTTWERWGTATSLAHLRFGGNTLVRDEMVLPPRQARYIRLSWPGSDAPPPIERVTATPAGREDPETQWARFEPVWSEANVYHFDQQGYLPVDRVGFSLPQPNTLIRVKLASSSDEDGPWLTRYEGLVYRLEVEGRDLTTPPLVLPQTADRFWQLTIDPTGGGLGQETPVLELGWTPDLLLFIPRGTAPYTLAFGRSGARSSAFEADELLQLLPNRRLDLSDLNLAAAGQVFELGGAERLTGGTELPWSQLALWGALLLGVAILAAMSIRLLRQIDRDRKEEAI